MSRRRARFIRFYSVKDFPAAVENDLDFMLESVQISHYEKKNSNLHLPAKTSSKIECDRAM